MPSLEVQRELVTARVHAEILTAVHERDDWLLVHLNYDRPGRVAYGSDTIFAGFEDHRELRGPRWRPLENARTLRDLGYRWVVAGPLTMAILARMLLSRRQLAGVVMHADAVRRWAPELAVPVPSLNSTDGFIAEGSPQYRRLGAPRPGRAMRRQLLRSCHFCGATSDLTLHHLLRRQMGGATEADNLLSVCRACHDKIHGGELDGSALLWNVSLRRIEKTLARSRDILHVGQSG